MFPSLINCASHHGKNVSQSASHRLKIQSALLLQMKCLEVRSRSTHITLSTLGTLLFLFTLKKLLLLLWNTELGVRCKSKADKIKLRLKTFTVAIIRLVKYDAFTNSVYMTGNNASIYKEGWSQYCREIWLAVFSQGSNKSCPFSSLVLSWEIQQIVLNPEQSCTAVRINIMFTLILWHNYWFGQKKNKKITRATFKTRLQWIKQKP